MRILIMGRSKSGTSAFAHAVLDSMPEPRTMLFEPRAATPAWTAAEGSIVAKVLIDSWWQAPSVLSDADVKLMILRDPRDILVSKVLYQCYEVAAHVERDAKLERYIALIEEKERDPGRVPMLRLLAAWADLCGISAPTPAEWGYDLAGCVVEFLGGNPGMDTVTYEDLVAGRYDTIEARLGFPLTGRARVPDELSRVSRTNASGSWRHWFTPDDVAYFRPALEAALDRLGYGHDWTLAAPQRIPSEFASGYVRRIVKNRRELMARDRTVWGPVGGQIWMVQRPAG